MDNLRAAFAWSLESSDTEAALTLASSLQPLWLTRGRIQEGLNWLDAALADETAEGAETSAARVRAFADRGLLLSFTGTTVEIDDAERTLATARELGDPALVARALTACGGLAQRDRELAGPYFAEAAGLARDIGDSRLLAQILALDALSALVVGEVVPAQAAAEEGLQIADSIGDAVVSRQCRFALCWVQVFGSDLSGTAVRLGQLAEESAADHDAMFSMYASVMRASTLAYTGDADGARAAAEAAHHSASELFEYYEGTVLSIIGFVHLAAGDASAAREAWEAARQRTGMDPQIASTYNWAAVAALACGDLAAARRWADDVVSATKGCYLSISLASRARVEIARGELDAAERDAYEALDLTARLGGDLVVPFALDCLAIAASDTGNHLSAARLFGAAEAARQHIGIVRFKLLQADDDARIAASQDALGENDFDAAWAEGLALSIQEAIAYAQRGRGERKRASSGWASLTRAELDVVRLVSEGLSNKEVAARLFVSPRTVQAHLTHIYTKLGLTSRVQLAQEAAKHGVTTDVGASPTT